MTTLVMCANAGRLSTRSQPIAIVATSGSGSGRAIDTALQLRDALRGQGCQIKLGVFSSLEGLRRWTMRDDISFSLLICVGGDGSQSAGAVAAVRRSVLLQVVVSRSTAAALAWSAESRAAIA